MTIELIQAVVRQTTVLIAQLAPSGGWRAPFAQIADQVFQDLATELERQGVSRKVSADMFGMGLGPTSVGFSGSPKARSSVAAPCGRSCSITSAVEASCAGGVEVTLCAVEGGAAAGWGSAEDGWAALERHSKP